MKKPTKTGTPRRSHHVAKRRTPNGKRGTRGLESELARTNRMAEAQKLRAQKSNRAYDAYAAQAQQITADSGVPAPTIKPEKEGNFFKRMLNKVRGGRR